MKPRERARRARQSDAQLARMAGQATDLAAGPMEGPAADAIRKQAEGQLGMRCSGCEKRITVGFRFTMIEVGTENGKPTVNVLTLSACNGIDDCDFAMQAKQDATAMEAVEFVWLDEDKSPEGDRERRAAAGADT